MRCCERGNGCHRNAPSGDCNKGGCKTAEGSECIKTSKLYEINELEIYYSMVSTSNNEEYSLDTVHSITSIQTKERIATDLEGCKYQSLDKMSDKVIEQLQKSKEHKTILAKDLDIFYILS